MPDFRDNQLNEHLEHGTRCDTIPLRDQSVTSLFNDEFEDIGPKDKKAGRWVGSDGGFQVFKENK